MRTPEVVRLSGATYRQVSYWASLGILPGVPRRPGNGQPRTWSTPDAHRIRLVASAVKHGFSPSYALRAAAAMEDEEVLGATELVIPLAG